MKSQRFTEHYFIHKKELLCGSSLFVSLAFGKLRIDRIRMELTLDEEV